MQVYKPTKLMTTKPRKLQKLANPGQQVIRKSQPLYHPKIKILSRASEVGSPTNHLGSRQRRDTGQGPFSPLTGGQGLPNDRLLKI